jgi:allantoinase
MSAPDLVIRSLRVVKRDGVGPASVHIKNGVIQRVGEFDDVPEGGPLHDAGNAVVMPGVVDSHVHINEPGRTEWEGFETATRAAAAGGVTTLVDMPLNSIPPTTSVKSLLTKAEAAEGRCWVDLGLWGGAVPGNAPELVPMIREGALGFKCFLIESGVPEFSHVSSEELHIAMTALQGSDAPLLVHAELPGPIEEARRARPEAEDERSYAGYVRSRPREAEDLAVELLFRFCNELRSRVHVVHLSSSGALHTMRRAQDSGLPMTAETTPHYLHFEAERVPPGATQFKCAPPIRERENRELLWSGLREGIVRMVVSDHSPCPASMKRLDEGSFDGAWGGISSLQLALPVTWTEARRRGASLTDLALWMCKRPAELAGLAHRKGSIAEGFDADIVVWDPEASFHVEPERLHHRHKITPYAGEELHGTVEMTLLRGVKVYDRSGHQSKPTGKWIKRDDR